MFLYLSNKFVLYSFMITYMLQEDFSDDDGLGGGAGGAPVTSQPVPGAQPTAPVFAMPPPSSATENTALNQSGQTSYTPGTQAGK